MFFLILEWTVPLIKLHKITFLLWFFCCSFEPWTQYQSVCSLWSTETTCFPPLRTWIRRAVWCGSSAESTSTPLCRSSSTWSLAFLSHLLLTPMTPSRWFLLNFCNPSSCFCIYFPCKLQLAFPKLYQQGYSLGFIQVIIQIDDLLQVN